MKNSALAILASLALLAFPLAAQVPEEEPTPLRDAAQEVEQEIDEVGNELEQAGDEVEQEAKEAAAEVDNAFDNDGDIDNDELPRTASPLAALILMGLAGAGSAFGVRSARRK